MSKNDSLNELVNLLVNSLSHKIGSIVNNGTLYAKKYRRDSENFLGQAKEISKSNHWNNYDNIEIKNLLKKKLIQDLSRKDFLDNKKFELVDEEIEKALKELDLL